MGAIGTAPDKGRLVQGPAAAYRAGVSVTRRSPGWPIFLTALAGAWIGHFVEYVRVAGWQAGVGDMTSSVHSYFFPVGAALMAGVVGASVLAQRAWTSLGDRLRAAEVGLWRRPATVPTGRASRSTRSVGLFSMWITLTVLQTGTWIFQENLEAVAGGHRAQLIGVLGGVHWMAPLVQAEVALILGVVYWVIQRWFAARRSRIAFIELLVARKWTPHYGLLPVLSRTASVPSTPLDRWGAQRWQRPPPLALVFN